MAAGSAVLGLAVSSGDVEGLADSDPLGDGDPLGDSDGLGDGDALGLADGWAVGSTSGEVSSGTSTVGNCCGAGVSEPGLTSVHAVTAARAAMAITATAPHTRPARDDVSSASPAESPSGTSGLMGPG